MRGKDKYAWKLSRIEWGIDLASVRPRAEITDVRCEAASSRQHAGLSRRGILFEIYRTKADCIEHVPGT